MQTHVLVAPVFQTNCVVVAAGDGAAGADAVIVDAGGAVAPAVRALIAERGYVVRAVLATHGHADHTWDAAALCAEYGAAFHLHSRDEYRLADPLGTLGLGGHLLAEMVASGLRQNLAAVGLDLDGYRIPAPVRAFEDGAVLEFGGLRLTAISAPGHTEGSTLYACQDGAEPTGRVLLTGDVLFAGGIGRTDLPGGDPAAMAATLRDVAGSLDPRLPVIPGHGPSTTIGRELAGNPYLG
ncbi:MAG: MBL fold metallo-hydrolase [Promicromonosporaceae bacterium]|nr:MBL fold metallo-hydrolase [Promicromonosporaceae bacterium]